RLSINMLVLVFSTVISVLLLEQATRCYLFGSACFDKRRMSSLVPFTLSGFVEASPFGDIHYTLKPGQSGWFNLAHFHSNAHAQPRPERLPQARPIRRPRRRPGGDDALFAATPYRRLPHYRTGRFVLDGQRYRYRHK